MSSVESLQMQRGGIGVHGGKVVRSSVWLRLFELLYVSGPRDLAQQLTSLSLRSKISVE